MSGTLNPPDQDPYDHDQRHQNIAEKQKTLDAHFMTLALQLGRFAIGLSRPNPSVGAVLVKNDRIIGRGYTQKGGRPHAEIMALHQAQKESAEDSCLYVTLEPCAHYGQSPPCVEAIIRAQIKRVVIGIEDPNPLVAGAGCARLREEHIEVVMGVHAKEAYYDHLGHILRMTMNRPFICVKMAQTQDGYMGIKSQRLIITDAVCHAQIHLLRAKNEAIITGIGTLRADNPKLTIRLPGAERYKPIRIILDTYFSLSSFSATTHLIEQAQEAPIWVLGGRDASAASEAVLRDWGIVTHRVGYASVKNAAGKAHRQELDLSEVFAFIAEQNIARVLVEAGPKLASALIEEHLADEVHIYESMRPLEAHGLDVTEAYKLSPQASSLLASESCYALADSRQSGNCVLYIKRHHRTAGKPEQTPLSINISS